MSVRMASEVDNIWQSLGVQICHVCQLKTSDITLFQTHVCQRITISFKKPLKVYVCSICKIELEEYYFIEHLQYHIQEKPFKCSYCDQDYETKKRVYSHLMRSHPQMKKTYGLKVDSNTHTYLQDARTKGRILITPFKKVVDREALEQTSEIGNDSPHLSQSSRVPSVSQAPQLSVGLPRCPHNPGKETTQADVVKGVQQSPNPHFAESFPPPARKCIFHKYVGPLQVPDVAVQPGNNIINQSSSTVKRDMFSTMTLSSVEETSKESYSYLSIFHIGNDIVYVCCKSECHVRFKDKHLYLHHIWKKHAHPFDNFSCCSSIFNITCPRLQTIIKLLHEKSMGLFDINSESSDQKEEETHVPCLEQMISCAEDTKVPLPLLSEFSPSTLACSESAITFHSNPPEYFGIPLHDPPCIVQLKREVEQVNYSEEVTESPTSQISENLATEEHGKEIKLDIGNSSTVMLMEDIACNGDTATASHTKKSENLAIVKENSPKGFKKDNQKAGMGMENNANGEASMNDISTKIYDSSAAEKEDDAEEIEGNLPIKTNCLMDNVVDSESLNKVIATNLSENVFEKNANVQKRHQGNCGTGQRTVQVDASERRVSVSYSDQISNSMNDLCVSEGDSKIILAKSCSENSKTETVSNTNNPNNGKPEISEFGKISTNSTEENNDFANNPVVKKDNPDMNIHDICNFYKCAFSPCNFSSCSPVQLLFHNQEDHGMERSFFCFYCGFEGASTGELLHHMDFHHLGESSDYYSGSIYENSLFREKVEHRFLDTMMSLVESKSRSIQNIGYTCNQCESKFSSLDTLRSHLESSTLRIYSCKHCRSNFLNSKSFESHNKEEHPGKPRFRRQESKLLCKDRAINKESFSKLVHRRNSNQDASNGQGFEKTDGSTSRLSEVNTTGSESYLKNHTGLNFLPEQLENNNMQTDAPKCPLVDCNPSFIHNPDNDISLTSKEEDTSVAEVAHQTGMQTIDSISKSKANKVDGFPESETSNESGRNENSNESLPNHCDLFGEKVTVLKEVKSKPLHHVSETPTNGCKLMPRIYDVCGKNRTAKYLASLYTQIQNGLYSCNNCFKEMTRLKGMLCHVFFCQGKTSVVNCPYDCAFESEHPKSVIEHIKQHHPTKDTSCKSFRCINDKKFFKFLKNRKVTQLIFEMACKPSNNGHMSKLKTFEIEAQPEDSENIPSRSDSKELVTNYVHCEEKVERGLNITPVSLDNFEKYSPFVGVSPNYADKELAKHNIKLQAPFVKFFSIRGQGIQKILKHEEKNSIEISPLTDPKDSVPLCVKDTQNKVEISLPGDALKANENLLLVDARGSVEMKLPEETPNPLENKLPQLGLPPTAKQIFKGAPIVMEIQLSDNGNKVPTPENLDNYSSNTAMKRRPLTVEPFESKQESVENGKLILERISSADYHCKPVCGDYEMPMSKSKETCQPVLEKDEAQSNTFSYSDQSTSHSALHHAMPFVNKNLKYQCKLCYLVFTFNIDHMRKHITEKHNFFACGYCERPYFKLSFLKNHIKFAHENAIPMIQPISSKFIFSRMYSSSEIVSDKDSTLQKKEMRTSFSNNFNSSSLQMENHSKKRSLEEIRSLRPNISLDFFEKVREKTKRVALNENSIGCKDEIEDNKQPLKFLESFPLSKAIDLNHQNLDTNYFASLNSKSAMPSDALQVASKVLISPRGSERQIFNEVMSKESCSKEPCSHSEESSNKMQCDLPTGRKHPYNNQIYHMRSDCVQPPDDKISSAISLKRKIDNDMPGGDILGNQYDIKRLCCDRLVHRDTCEMEKRSEVDFPWFNQSDCSHENLSQPNCSEATNLSSVTDQRDNPLFHMPTFEECKRYGEVTMDSLMDKLFSCKICMVSFSSISEIRVHFINDHSNSVAQWSDRRVGVDFSSDGEKLYDKKDVRPSVTRYLCGNCNFDTKMKESMTNHMSLAHDTIDTSVDYHYAVPFCHLEQIVYAEKCYFKDDKRPTQSCSHEIVMTEKPRPKLRYRCHICDKCSHSEFHFRLHLAEHGGFKHCSTLFTIRGLLICATCGYVASSSNDLGSHVSRHMTQRRYCCSDCDFDDHYRRGVYVHIRRFHSESSSAHVIVNKVQNRDVDIRPKLVDLNPTVYLPKLELEEIESDDDYWQDTSCTF